MCLILFACHTHPDYPLVLAANRDEFFARPAEAARWWTTDPGLLAGRDLGAGGTWLGVTRTGGVAAVTNYREPAHHNPAARSRGDLPLTFLRQDTDLHDFQVQLRHSRAHYNGYNLLFGTVSDLYYFCNRGGNPKQLDPGIYGLSNHMLDTPWPKVRTGKQALAKALKHSSPDLDLLWDALDDTSQATDRELPDTGIGLAWERKLSSIRIVGDHYGTRASTLLLCRKDGLVQFTERSYSNTGKTSEVSYHFQLEPAQ